MVKNLGVILLALLLFGTVAHAATGSAFIAASAVTGLGSGNLTTIFLNVSAGNGNVIIKGPTSITPDTVQSAQQAVAYATSYLNINQNKYNFTYLINYSSVSGPSGGLALALLAISTLSGTPLLHNFAVTGTVNSNGAVGQIGGIYEKASAAKAQGKKFMIVPYAANGTFENTLYYIVQQNLGIPLVKVSNVSQALPYAYGIAKPKPFVFNATQNYFVNLLPSLNLTCASCNISNFKVLSFGTLNLTSRTINSISGNYSSLKSMFLNSLNDFSNIMKKGYLYTGADLSFLTLSNVYIFANSNFSKTAAATLINNATNYCTSLTPPLMTTTNYEYVIGGEIRQTWGLITLNNSKNTLSGAQTTDDVAQSIYQAGNANAWCFAASTMYQIAASSSSNFVNLSKSALQGVYLNVTNAQKYPGLYSQAAQIDYKSGLYAAALYNSKYAAAFGNNTYSTYTNSQLINMTKSNVLNSSNLGIWPFEFGAQALFYLKETALQGNLSSSSSVLSAYTISNLAKNLGSANKMLSTSFVQINPSNSTAVFQNGTAITNLQAQVNQIYVLLFLILVLVFFIFILLLVLLLKNRSVNGAKEGFLQLPNQRALGKAPPASRRQQVQRPRRR